MNDDDRAIDAFLAQCGTTRAPASLPTPRKELPYDLRRKLSTAEVATTPNFNLGANHTQGLTAGFRASRSVGDCRHVIKEVEAVHGDVSDADVTYAAKKANLSPLKDTSGKWTGEDTRKLRGSF